MRLRSRISVLQTTSESMLKPLPARMPDTRDSTPGSFCTRQFRTCLRRPPRQSRSRGESLGTHLLNGWRLGGGVL